MKPKITIERLNIYRKYAGDIDGLLRMQNKAELDAFGSYLGEVWGELSMFRQDIVLIENGIASKEYTYASIEKMKSLCDEKAFDELTNVIRITTLDLLEIGGLIKKGTDK